MSMEQVSDKDAAFYEKTERAFRSLFEAAKSRHELHFAMALMPEFRGMQDAGWSTAEEAQRAFDEYLAFLETISDQRMRSRIALSFYAHVSEAAGFYEIPKNMLRIAEGKSHVLWPFMDLVQAHRTTGERIAPNSNKIQKDLIGHAVELGLVELSEVLREAFDPDIRNGYAHADYVIWPDGLRLPKRNGGRARRVSWEEFSSTFNRAINFFHILRQIVSEYVQSYDPPKTIRAALQNEPAMDWTIAYDPSTGSFGISSGK